MAESDQFKWRHYQGEIILLCVRWYLRYALREEGALPNRTHLRQSKYLNNIIGQDYRFIKRRINLTLGFFSFKTAWRTIRGYETINIIRKGQIAGIGRGAIQRQVRFVSNLFGIAA